MTRNDTPKQTAVKLKPKQVLVIEKLLMGQSVTEASKSSGVSRETTHRWMKEDWHFQAALNLEKKEIIEGIYGKMSSIAEKAIDVVCNALEEGDVRTALTILKGTGYLTGTMRYIGLTDPDELKKKAETGEQTDEIIERERKMTLLEVEQVFLDRERRLGLDRLLNRD